MVSLDNFLKVKCEVVQLETKLRFFIPVSGKLWQDLPAPTMLNIETYDMKADLPRMCVFSYICTTFAPVTLNLTI